MNEGAGPRRNPGPVVRSLVPALVPEGKQGFDRPIALPTVDGIAPEGRYQAF